MAVLQLTDKFFLTNMRGLDDTGVYSIAFKFGGIMSIIVYSTNLAWQPFFMKNAEQKGEDAPPLFARLTTYWLMAMMLAALGITFFSSEAIQLFTFSAPFRAAAPLTPIFVFAYLAHGMYMLAALQVFYDKRAVRIIPLATVTAGLTNIGLNALLIPHWGMYGAAWATFISHFVNLTFALIVAQRHYFIPYEWKRILALFGMTGLAVAAYYALHLLGLGVWSAAAAKLAIIAVWLLALLVTGFLSPSERANMLDMTRQILKARKQSNR